MLKLGQWVVCKKMTEEYQAVQEIRERWEQAGEGQETHQTGPPQTPKQKNIRKSSR